ncbi:MAG: TIGR02678 family protein [Opitutaceae bacterium]|nr:TIGR02678 family protein [Opitutaceae bacterium]
MMPQLSSSLSRRARLARLREEAEPLVEEERRTAVRTLLQRPLLIPEGEHAPAFVLVRRHREWLTDWFAHHLDWPLVVTAEAARLRKRPAASTDATRPARDPRSGEPFNRTRYVLFCLALAVLERGDRQITLGRLAEQIEIALSADPAFARAGFLWSRDEQSGRRDLVHALRLLVDLGALRRIQGDEEHHLRDRTSDVLYNVSRPVLSLLLGSRRSPSLTTATDDFDARLHALHASELPESPEARNRAIRAALAARLVDDPALYYAELDDEARAYLDRQRTFLLDALCSATELHPEVRAEGLALTDLNGHCTDAGLPEEGTEGHLVLLLATWLADRLRDGESSPLTLETVRQKTARLIRQHRHHWKKEIGLRGAEIPFTELVLDRLEGLALIERIGDSIRALPAIGRFALRAGTDLSPSTEENLELGLASDP